MKIKWLAHSSFLLTSDSGTRVITDPYTTGGPVRYGEIKETADVVTMSHGHDDHNNSQAVRGNPVVLTSGGREVKGVKITSIATHHDEASGQKRGSNTIFCFDIDGLRVCHLGDLGHLLNTQQLSQLGKVDVLLVPVGGYYTIDAAVASMVVDSIKPKIVIPMHFKTASLDYPIVGAEDFIRGKKNVRQLDSSETEVKADSLPAATEIVVLRPAL